MNDPDSLDDLEEVGIPERDKPPFVRLPEPGTMFALRAMRFSALAPGHQLEPYLNFLAGLSRIQDELTREIEAPALPPLDRLRPRARNGMPVIPREELAGHPSTYAALERLIAKASDMDMPEAARTALEHVRAADKEACREIVAAVLSDTIPAEEVAEHVFVAAALQVVAAQRAARLPERLPQPVADGVCPACGGPPLASAVMSFGTVENTRYVQCAQCATRWNHVRVKCVSCGSTKGIAYQVIEGVADTIKAETCDECRTYVKILYQNKDKELEPVADDVASLGLDLLVAEAGWKRAGVNPFLLGY